MARARVENGHTLLLEADGSAAMRPHPATGHLLPVMTYELAVFLDGVATECFAADEEAGTVEVWIGRDPWSFPSDCGREVRRGKVEIRVTPMGGTCGCAECDPEVAAAAA